MTDPTSWENLSEPTKQYLRLVYGPPGPELRAIIEEALADPDAKPCLPITCISLDEPQNNE